MLILDLDEAEAVKLLLALDPLAAMAEPDGEALEALLRQVDTDNPALSAMFDELARESGLNAGGRGDGDPDDVPEPGEPISGLGDLWALGEHRLLCGDATDAGGMRRPPSSDRST